MKKAKTVAKRVKAAERREDPTFNSISTWKTKALSPRHTRNQQLDQVPSRMDLREVQTPQTIAFPEQELGNASENPILDTEKMPDDGRNLGYNNTKISWKRRLPRGDTRYRRDSSWLGSMSPSERSPRLQNGECKVPTAEDTDRR